MPPTIVAARPIVPSDDVVPANDAIPSNDCMPGDLLAFDAWLAASDALPGARWSPHRALPTGPVAAPVMLIGDVPDPADIDAGHILAGPGGALIEAMLAAIGLSRSACRVASIALSRPIGGRLEGAEARRLVAITRHHIALARPHTVLLLGQQTAELLLDEAVAGPPRQYDLNHDGGTVAAFAIHHPRVLLERPTLKRPTWDMLKCLRESLPT